MFWFHRKEYDRDAQARYEAQVAIRAGYSPRMLNGMSRQDTPPPVAPREERVKLA